MTEHLIPLSPNIAIYTRVSDARDKSEGQLRKSGSGKQSLESADIQREHLLTYCRKMNWDIENVKEYRESASATSRRPVLAELMQDCFQRKIDIVLVWKIDRLARNMYDFTRIITELSQRHVRFISVTQGIDTDESNPTSRLLMNVLAAMAEFERDLLSERIKVGMEKRKQKGLEIGRPKRIFDIHKVIRMRNDGKSLPEIAKELRVGVSTIERRLRKYYAEKNS